MKALTRCAIILLAVLLAASSLFAQSPPIPVCDEAVSLPKTSAGCLEVDYDRFTGIKTAALKFLVASPPNDTIVLMFTSTTSDNKKDMIRQLTSVGVVSVRRGLLETESTVTLHVLADGKRFTVQLALSSADYPDKLMTRELFGSGISVEDLNAFGNAATLEMRFRQREFALDVAGRKSLQLFAAYCSLATAD